jgi:hypothetical protein
MATVTRDDPPQLIALPSRDPSSGRRLGERVRRVAEAIAGLLLMVPTVLGAPLLRRAYNRWGTTKGEVPGSHAR